MTAQPSTAYGDRMPRVHVSLPRELYDEMKSHGWSASDVLQEGLRRRLADEARQREREEWYQELVAKLGPPTPEDEEFVDRLVRNTLGREPER